MSPFFGKARPVVVEPLPEPPAPPRPVPPPTICTCGERLFGQLHKLHEFRPGEPSVHAGDLVRCSGCGHNWIMDEGRIREAHPHADARMQQRPPNPPQERNGAASEDRPPRSRVSDHDLSFRNAER